MVDKIPASLPENEFAYTNNWFGITSEKIWDQIIPQFKPTKILEIGSYEGRSSCYLIEKLGQNLDIELHCIDTWKGGLEHQSVDMQDVEARFRHNTELALRKVQNNVQLIIHKDFSDISLSSLLCNNKRNYFEFIYIDGSHQASDVLCDAVLSFRLLKVGGIMGFDDYLWAESLPYGKDILRCPKPAIDAFINLNFRKIKILNTPLSQVYIQKVSD